MELTRPADENIFSILKRLAGEGYLQNIRQLEVDRVIRSPLIVELICLMKNLETLDLRDQEMTLDSLAHVFQSCSKITRLHISKFEYTRFEMSEHLKNQLRSGFQRLRFFGFTTSSINNDSWPLIQETLTLVNRFRKFLDKI